MALTVRGVVEALYRYLRKELRAIPYDATLENPLPDALLAINGTLQELAVGAPLFAAKQTKSALFRASETVTVTAAAQYGTTATKGTAWDDRMLGCKITLAGESQPNRILSISTVTATLQNAILGASAAGSAVVAYDCVELPSNVIAVHTPVRFVGGARLRPSNNRFDLDQPLYESTDDYGRVRLSPVQGSANKYLIQTHMQEGVGRPKLRMMLRDAPTIDSVVQYEARCSLGYFTSADVAGAAPGYTDPATAIPIPNEFVETLFLPLAVMRFFSTPIMRDVTPPTYVEKNAQAAAAILEAMRPQARTPAVLYPSLG